MTISTGIITTIAGSSTSGKYSGDNGPATSAELYNPTDIELDSAGASALHEFGIIIKILLSYFIT